MGGKTLTIGSMTIEAIQGKDGVGAAAGDTVKEGSFGQDGGMASAQGIYSTSISNAVIAMNGDVKIEALGGKTYSEALIGSVYQHQGEKGNDGATDGKLNGGEGAKGGTGGKAVAAGVEIGNGSSVRITGGSLTVSAIGEAGGHGGYGGEGGIGATGADGAIGTSFNQEYLDTKTAQGTDQTVGQANENGHNGKAGAIGGTATAGLTGGTGGNGADGGTGGMAEANGLKIKNITNSSIVLNGLQVTAVAGNGSAGGQGGKGGTGGVGGNGGAGGNGSFGEKGGALGLDDLTATNDGVATSVSTAFPGTPVTGDNVTVTTTTTQHQLLAGKTYGGAGGAGGAGATGAIGGVGGQGGNGGNGGSLVGGDGIRSGGGLTVSDGTVTAKGGNGDSKDGYGGDGIRSGGVITISGNTVNAAGGYGGKVGGYGICSFDRVAISGGTVEAAGGNGSTGGGSGIYSSVIDLSGSLELTAKAGSPNGKALLQAGHELDLDTIKDKLGPGAKVTVTDADGKVNQVSIPRPVEPEEPVIPEESSSSSDGGSATPSTPASPLPGLTVTDKSGAVISYTSTQSGNTLTVCVGRFTASFRISLAALRQLRAEGIETITFQTILCSTTLSVDELLAMGGEDAEAVLTHRLTDSSLTVG